MQVSSGALWKLVPYYYKPLFGSANTVGNDEYNGFPSSRPCVPMLAAQHRCPHWLSPHHASTGTEALSPGNTCFLSWPGSWALQPQTMHNTGFSPSFWGQPGRRSQHCLCWSTCLGQQVPRTSPRCPHCEWQQGPLCSVLPWGWWIYNGTKCPERWTSTACHHPWGRGGQVLEQAQGTRGLPALCTSSLTLAGEQGRFSTWSSVLQFARLQLTCSVWTETSVTPQEQTPIRQLSSTPALQVHHLRKKFYSTSTFICHLFPGNVFAYHDLISQQ